MKNINKSKFFILLVFLIIIVGIIIWVNWGKKSSNNITEEIDASKSFFIFDGKHYALFNEMENN